MLHMGNYIPLPALVIMAQEFLWNSAAVVKEFIFIVSAGRILTYFSQLQTRSKVCIRLKCINDLPPLLPAIGAGEGIRTLDPNLGKVVLYH